MLRVFFCTVLILFYLAKPSKSHAQNQSVGSIDPKTKAFVIICGYGTVGGALLGLASMALGKNLGPLLKVRHWGYMQV